MKRQIFFNVVRLNPHKGRLSQRQVEGMEALLDAAAGLPIHHVANILAQVHRETGGRMYPVRETFADSDEQAIARLDRAWAAGQLKWVREPYWRDGWFGRGQIQLTHRSNYAKFGISDPADAMRPHISAHVAVTGMRDGLFTGKKLADYTFPDDLDNPPATNPRRIVNGRDGSDAEVTEYHHAYHAALVASGYVSANPLASTPVDDSGTPSGYHQPRRTILDALRDLAALFQRRP